MRNKKKHIFVGIAISLIIVGGIFFVKEGVLRILDDKEDKEIYHCGKLWRCLPLHTDYQVKKNNITVANLTIELNFKTEGEFAVDNRIDYIIDITSDTPNVVKDIQYMIAFTEKNYSDLTDKEFLDVRDDAEEDNMWIYLDTLSSIKFYDKDFFTVPREDKISLIGFVIDYENKVHVIPKSEKLLDIKPHKDFIDAKQTFELRIYNRIILGLVWIGITIPFLLVGADILLRIYLRENEIDKWFIDKSKYDLDPI